MDSPNRTPERLSDCRKSRTPSPVSRPESPNRAKSPESCSICLCKMENVSHTDSCGHKFCFTCLLEWSKVNPVCPLCKTAFKAIIHTIHSESDYKSYTLPERPPPERRFPPGIDFEVLYQGHGPLVTPAQMWHPYYGDFTLPAAFQVSRRARRLATSDFRRSIYEGGRYVRPESVVDAVTGRYRECSPSWYRDNPAQTHRLVPWLNRELTALTAIGQHQRIPHVLQNVLEYVQRYPIQSPDFRMVMEPYIGPRAAHFQHEFFNFARSVYDMVGYDREAQYQDNPVQPAETFLVSSDPSDSEDNVLPISPSSPLAPPLTVDVDVGEPGPSSRRSPSRPPQEPICINSSEEDDVEVLTHVKNETPVIVNIPSSSDDAEVIEGLPAFDSFSKRVKARERQASVSDEDLELIHRFKGKGKGKSSKGAKKRAESEERRKRRRKKKKRKRVLSSESESEEERGKRRKVKREEEDDLRAKVKREEEDDLRAKVERLKSLARPRIESEDDEETTDVASAALKPTIRRSVRFV